MSNFPDAAATLERDTVNFSRGGGHLSGKEDGTQGKILTASVTITHD